MQGSSVCRETRDESVAGTFEGRDGRARGEGEGGGGAISTTAEQCCVTNGRGTEAPIRYHQKKKKKKKKKAAHWFCLLRRLTPL